MTSEPSESDNGSAAASENVRAALYDFVYLDRSRISSYHAQLTNLGVWTGITTTEGTTSEKKRDGSAGVPKVLGGALSVTTSSEETSQRQYDPAMIVAIDTIERLEDEGSIRFDPAAAEIGSLVLVTGVLSVLDVGLIKEMWEPFATLFQQQQGDEKSNFGEGANRQQRRAAQRANVSQPIRPAAANPFASIAEIARKLPHPVQATIESDKGDSLWAALEAEHFVGSPEALTLKHGASIAGDWSVFCILDAKPDAGLHVTPSGSSPSNIADAIRFIQTFIRQQFGRPEHAYAITPLAIYRPVPRGDAS